MTVFCSNIMDASQVCQRRKKQAEHICSPETDFIGLASDLFLYFVNCTLKTWSFITLMQWPLTYRSFGGAIWTTTAGEWRPFAAAFAGHPESDIPNETESTQALKLLLFLSQSHPFFLSQIMLQSSLLFLFPNCRAGFPLLQQRSPIPD